eukprot:TRINITY_DN10464_c0_g1_i1.p1 TRINITY_DN10464_c0_g1~~TRINITY_DN10464_c0_g1_i1.p1  ORF type:complete len:435 (-),score=48.73 TRINITY_DN10464_c0_g1_i1:152-1411(-)
MTDITTERFLAYNRDNNNIVEVGRGKVDFSNYGDYPLHSYPPPTEAPEVIIPSHAPGLEERQSETPHISEAAKTTGYVPPKVNVIITLLSGFVLIAGWPSLSLYQYFLLSQSTTYTFDYPFIIGSVACLFVAIILFFIHVIQCIKKSEWRQLFVNWGCGCSLCIGCFAGIIFYRIDHNLCDKEPNVCLILFLCSLIVYFIASLSQKHERKYVVDVFGQLIGLFGIGLTLWDKSRKFPRQFWADWELLTCGASFAVLFGLYIVFLRKGVISVGPQKSLFAQTFLNFVVLFLAAIFIRYSTGDIPWKPIFSNGSSNLLYLCGYTLLMMVWISSIVITAAYSDGIITANLLFLSLYFGDSGFIANYWISGAPKRNLLQFFGLSLVGLFMLYNGARIFWLYRLRYAVPKADTRLRISHFINEQ